MRCVMPTKSCIRPRGRPSRTEFLTSVCAHLWASHGTGTAPSLSHSNVLARAAARVLSNEIESAIESGPVQHPPMLNCSCVNVEVYIFISRYFFIGNPLNGCEAISFSQGPKISDKAPFRYRRNMENAAVELNVHSAVRRNSVSLSEIYRHKAQNGIRPRTCLFFKSEDGR